MANRIKNLRLKTIKIARDAAIERGDERFTPDVPCKHGHMGEWYTFIGGVSPRCCRCLGVRNRGRDPDKILAAAKGWRVPDAEWKKPNKCECCGRLQGRKSFHRDHDHGTGRFRGWLCSQCNTGIGMLGDSVLGVLAAAEYLQTDREQWW